MGDPSFSWTRWSSKSCSSIALYIFTGALTSPKAMLPDQIARGMSVDTQGQRSAKRAARGRSAGPTPVLPRGGEQRTPRRPGRSRFAVSRCIPFGKRGRSWQRSDVRVDPTNAQIVDQLALFATLLELADRSTFAVRAYRRAAELVRSWPAPVAALVR